MALFSDDDLARLAGPHVSRCWFGEFDLPSGFARLHSGVGTLTVAGYEWRGVSDPVGGQMVSISPVEDMRFGTAPKIDIIVASVSSAFFASVKADARAIEGRDANIYFGVFDGEDGSELMFRKLFPGTMTAPSLHRSGVGTRYIRLGVESFWEAQNYPFGGRWNPADQRRRVPGDKGLDFIGVKVSEQWE